MDNTAYLFLAAAGVMFVLAVILIFSGNKKGEKEKNINNQFDDEYAVLFTDHFLKSGSIRKTLGELSEFYNTTNPHMESLIDRAIDYLGGDYGDYETALEIINENDDEMVAKAHKDAIHSEFATVKGLPNTD